jgi:hypothetical protein
MGPLAWMMTMAGFLGAQGAEGGSLSATVNGETAVIEDVGFHFPDTKSLVIWSGKERPGVRFLLYLDSTYYRGNGMAEQEIWLSPAQGGGIERLCVMIDERTSDRIRGRWQGVLVDERGQTGVSGIFDLPARAVPQDAPDSSKLGVFAMAGCFVFAMGLIGMAFTNLWLLVIAFRESVGWGLGSMFLPFVSWIFVILHWDDAKRPFLMHLGFAGVVGLAALMMAR